MKKIINTPERVVDEMCEGFEMAHGELVTLNRKYRVLRRKELNPNKVSLISGGGSGHEPAHAGYVGKGMLDAAVCGDVFASPSIMQVYNAILDVKSDKGVLLIIKNYSGDRMNFDGAAEMAAENDQIRVERVYVNDDVAVSDSLYTVGRRGVAGTVFVHKVAGALAEAGAELAEVKRVAEKVIANTRSMGFALTSCTVPAKGSPTFQIADDDLEFGVGIHGEPGVAREKVRSASELGADLLDRIVPDLPFQKGDEVALMVNGLGATPVQELYILNRTVNSILGGKGICVWRTWIGNLMTSIDMAGASVTLFRLDEETKRLLSAPAQTPALRM